jgi:hypothetical protein
MKVLAATLAFAALLVAPAGTDIAGYRDDARGVSALVPDGWHAAGPLTALAFPREVVTLASFCPSALRARPSASGDPRTSCVSATPAGRRTVERVLDGLRFDALPAPPADPQANYSPAPP